MPTNLKFRTKISNTTLMVFVLIPVAYLASYFLLNFYILGDQVYYHRLYEALNVARLDQILMIGHAHVSSSEPVSLFILWAGAKIGIEKNIYISILNTLLIVSIFILARRHRVKMPMIALMLTNFYVVVLMTGAERLKISYLFFVFAALSAGRIKYLLLTVTPFAHLQSFIQLAGLFSGTLEIPVKNLITRFAVSKKNVLALGSILCVGLLIVYLLFDGIIKKAFAYATYGHGLMEFFQIFILWGVAIIVTRRRLQMSLMLSTLVFFVAILGGIRVNMIAVTLVISYLMVERRLNHPLIYGLMIYFSIKTIPFVHNIIRYGNGFAH